VYERTGVGWENVGGEDEIVHGRRKKKGDRMGPTGGKVTGAALHWQPIGLVEEKVRRKKGNSTPIQREEKKPQKVGGRGGGRKGGNKRGTEQEQKNIVQYG